MILETHSPAYFIRRLAAFLARFADRRAKTRVVFAETILLGNRKLVNQLPLADVVETRGYLPHGESAAPARAADALLLPMFSTPNPTERVAYASGKVFEYMAARRPILALVQEKDEGFPYHSRICQCQFSLRAQPEPVRAHPGAA